MSTNISRVQLTRITPSIIRAAIAGGNLDRSRLNEADFFSHGCSDCLDAADAMPTGGFGYATVIGSRASIWRGA